MNIGQKVKVVKKGLASTGSYGHVSMVDSFDPEYVLVSVDDWGGKLSWFSSESLKVIPEKTKPKENKAFSDRLPYVLCSKEVSFTEELGDQDEIAVFLESSNGDAFASVRKHFVHHGIDDEDIRDLILITPTGRIFEIKPTEIQFLERPQ